MNPRPLDREDPDRLYTVTRGRSEAGDDTLDLVALIVAEDEPEPGMQSEHAAILRLCRGNPVAVVELSARLRLPVSVMKILLLDLRDMGRITVRHPSSAAAPTAYAADLETLKQVLVGLESI
ncbi:DUF742 domain-containing protein [Actinomadura livida]|uniref:DUF742 domain-containing protein n=1 Tax=Actinomadura livida TaxID=79909 RepID=A0A7W7I937_9ACTN|nr:MULTISPECIES: DUF742 domain-containing protein [Actinomadura]MBB4772693.1 hypothetical protein [Actinomadura catellatispora]GGU12179.1 hypothetical protein GCM10010208_41080 [Actinomadura livida]